MNADKDNIGDAVESVPTKTQTQVGAGIPVGTPARTATAIPGGRPNPRTATMPGMGKVKRPEGWWAFSNSGSLDGICRAIDGTAEIPDYWKAALKTDLALRCSGELNFVYLDAHFHVEKGRGVLHYTARAEKKLL